ncbi:hypothetical protein V7O66_12915 [Methanolobus sp. ZRKC3]|uniref:hypothetical protein n=1 Tax=Methanolobus sp. ZRKC3 TaxID=3125786 RepID=UPI003249BBE0
MVFFLVLMSGNASARVEIYNGTITEGDGYQMNNFVIDVTDVFVEAETASFYVYNRGRLQEDFLLSEGDAYDFDFIGDATVKVTLVSVKSGTLPVAKISVVMSNYNIADLYENDVLDGGHDYATYSGTPVLKIRKEMAANTIGVGETVRVTITAENTGDDAAVDVIFSDPQQAKFVLDEDFLGHPGKSTIDVGESKTIFLYNLKATEAGSYNLNPTTASFSNSAGQSFPQASSNSPILVVEGSDLSKAAMLEFTTDIDVYTVKRKDVLQGTVNIKNTGDSSATAVTVGIIVPDGLEYVDGDASIEVISGVPTIYLDSFGVQQEKEVNFRLKAQDVGAYTISTENSYLFDDGVNAQMQKVSSDFVSNTIYVVEGKYDYLFEQPLYVYLIPLLIIGAISGWLFHRHKQYKF